jgi:hypothetical protein
VLQGESRHIEECSQLLRVAAALERKERSMSIHKLQLTA